MIETKKLNIVELEFTDAYPDLKGVAARIENHGTRSIIAEVNWPEFSCTPEVILFCAYTKKEILLKYRVKEKNILARCTEINDPVFKDSCVEFFISCGNAFYYNFEFNCIGTPYAGYGTQREGRTLLDERKISKIRTYSSLGRDEIAEIREIDGYWELTIAIPFDIFKEPEYRNPRNHSFKSNFYKCGDDLPDPHYLSWNSIGIANPDFHRPEFFGDLNFV